jgi:hypothetical protein
MGCDTTFKQLADQAEGRVCSLVTSCLKERAANNLHVAGGNCALVLADPKLRVVVVPSILAPCVLRQLWHDIVIVSNTIVVSLRRRLALDIVGDILVSEFRLAKGVLHFLAKLSSRERGLLTISTVIPLFLSSVPSSADIAPPRLWPVTTTLKLGFALTASCTAGTTTVEASSMASRNPLCTEHPSCEADDPQRLDLTCRSSASVITSIGFDQIWVP